MPEETLCDACEVCHYSRPAITATYIRRKMNGHCGEAEEMLERLSVANFNSKAKILNEGMLNGSLGCVFANEAAKSKQVRFADIGRDSHRLGLMQAALTPFLSSTDRVLTCIPHEDPQSYSAGKDLAMEIYEQLILALRKINEESIDLLSASCHTDINDLVESLEVQRMSDSEIHERLTQANVIQAVCSSFARKGFLALQTVRKENGKRDLIVPFAIGSYYDPVNPPLPHPRYAPNFSVILTLDSDIQRVCREQINEVASTRKWEESAVGYLYAQGYHIPLKPEQSKSGIISIHA